MEICRKGFFLSDRLIKFVIISILVFPACNHVREDGNEIVPHSEVMITQPVKKDTSVFSEYQGITHFMQHVQIRSQLAGIISKSMVSVSSAIKKDDPLFVIKSREASILSESIPQNAVLSRIADTIVSFSSGIIDQVLVQEGDFVQEGDLLATCVSEHSMRILISVPVEENLTEFQNKSCIIQLPDGRDLPGTVGPGLPVASVSDQTKQFIIYPATGAGISENIHVRVCLKKQDIINGMFVPKNSVYSNEELTNHWVFKIIHDTIARKVEVNTGLEVDSFIQITDSSLHYTDHIIFKGGYGLSDSALVNIIQ